MQWQSASEYLMNWSLGIGKEGKEFVSRVEKIYSNLRGRLEREEKMFH
jgi:hypothetical protein